MAESWDAATGATGTPPAVESNPAPVGPSEAPPVVDPTPAQTEPSPSSTASAESPAAPYAATEEPTSETPVEEQAEPEPEPDLRQRWVCVTTDGPRTNRNGIVCPAFHSDQHLTGGAFSMDASQPGSEPVRCPTCSSVSVRRAFPGE